MTTTSVHHDGLVPAGVRLRWVLLGRAVLVALVPLGLLLDGADGAVVRTLAVAAAGWLVLTVPTLLAPRIGPAVARVTFTATVLGDGVLLCLLWWSLGGLGGAGAHLVWLHCAAVTLLGSLRTGVKATVWQGLLALVVLEAGAAGVLGPATPFDMGDLIMYQITLLVTVPVTAALAAVSRRELRRRRSDSDVLRRLAGDLAHDREVDEIIGMLGAVAVRQWRAPRAAVLVWRITGPSAAAVTTADGTTIHPGAPTVAPDTSVVAAALRDGRTRYLTRLDPLGDGGLAAMLPGARNLIVVPFVLDRVSGVLVMVAPRSRGGRVERRVGDAAEQATALAAGALGRAVLTENAHPPVHPRRREHVA